MLQNTMDLLELDLLSDSELHSTCSAFFGGRKRLAAQRTHRELAPTYAAGKVLVPWGRSATGRPEDLDFGLTAKQTQSCGPGVLVLCSSKVMHERFQERQLNGAHSFHALFQTWFVFSLHRLRNVCRHVFEPEFAELLQRLLLRNACTIPAADRQYNGTTGVGMLQNTMDLLELDLLSDSELHSTCSAFFGGRKSMAAQRTHRDLLPHMLWGKSSCLGAESATGRPEDLDFGAYSEANAELWSWCFGPLQQQSHAMERFQERQPNGAHSFHALFLRLGLYFLCTD